MISMLVCALQLSVDAKLDEVVGCEEDADNFQGVYGKVKWMGKNVANGIWLDKLNNSLSNKILPCRPLKRNTPQWSLQRIYDIYLAREMRVTLLARSKSKCQCDSGDGATTEALGSTGESPPTTSTNFCCILESPVEDKRHESFLAVW